jgi:hypothetical protein
MKTTLPTEYVWKGAFLKDASIPSRPEMKAKPWILPSSEIYKAALIMDTTGAGVGHVILTGELISK